MTVEILLEQAMILDWAYRFEESARRTERAIELMESLADARLLGRARMALGRTRWRQERVPEAIAILEDAAGMAGAAGDEETQDLAHMLLAPALVAAGRYEESERRFADVIDALVARRDLAHLGGALVNRMTLWAQVHDPARTHEDARRAIQVAREIGAFQVERIANYNVAELLLWEGQLDSALEHARRSRALQLRFVDPPGPEDTLLCARVLAAHGEPKEAQKMVTWVETRCPANGIAPSFRALLSAVKTFCQDETSDSDWKPVLELARSHSVPDERLEILYLWTTRIAQRDRTEPAWTEAQELAKDRPCWRERFQTVAEGEITKVQ